MAESVYEVIELIGASPKFMGKRRQSGQRKGGGVFAGSPDCRSDATRYPAEGRKGRAFRTKLKVSFKYEGGDYSVLQME